MNLIDTLKPYLFSPVAIGLPRADEDSPYRDVLMRIDSVQEAYSLEDSLYVYELRGEVLDPDFDIWKHFGTPESIRGGKLKTLLHGSIFRCNDEEPSYLCLDIKDLTGGDDPHIVVVMCNEKTLKEDYV